MEGNNSITSKYKDYPKTDKGEIIITDITFNEWFQKERIAWIRRQQKTGIYVHTQGNFNRINNRLYEISRNFIFHKDVCKDGDIFELNENYNKNY